MSLAQTASFAPCMARVHPSASGAASQRARELAARGRDIISLTLGEPDFDTPLHVQDAAIHAIRTGVTKYTTADGTPELKAAIARKFARDNDLEYAADQITVANGAKQVIFNALIATLQPGDEVLIPSPYWVSYPEIVSFAGGTPIVLNTLAAGDFKITPEQLARAVTGATRWLILNSPCNPTGTTYTRGELQALADVLAPHDRVWVLSDDIYEHITYDGLAFATMARAAPALYQRTLTVNGLSKAYAMTGWRIGYAGGPKALVRLMTTLQSQSTSCPSSISQAAGVAALDGPQDLLSKNAQVFQERRDLIVAKVNEIPDLECRSPKGAFYAYVSCAAVLGKVTPQGKTLTTDGDFGEYLLEEANVAVVSGAAYGASPYVRLSFALPRARIEEACVRIERACARLS